MINYATHLQGELRKIIYAALNHPYESISKEGLKTGNHYQSVQLRGEESRGFRSNPAELLDQIDLRGKKVLDLGSNLGETSRAAREHGADLVDGFEIDELFLQLANLINAYNNTSRVSYFKRDIGEQSSYQEHYDIVFALSVFEHVRDTIEHIALITDQCLILETYKLEDNLYPIYIEPLLPYFPYNTILGYLPWSANDKNARRAWIAFAKDQATLDKVLRSQSAPVAIEEISPQLEEKIKKVVSLLIPHNGVISVVNSNNKTLWEFNRVGTLRFRESDQQNPFRNSASMIARIQELKQKNAQYLLIPATEFWCLEKYPEIKTYLETEHHLVAEEEGVCLIYALHTFDQKNSKNMLDFDGLPLPPGELIALVTSIYDQEVFYRTGSIGAESIKQILEANDLNINEFDSILDFGCGCGRIMRHWKTLDGPRLFGTDYNPYLIEWSQKNLLFAEFQTNQLIGQLDYKDNAFEFIYTISIFTHLEERLQHFWIEELRRILKPGGYLLLTVHGETRLHELTPAQLTRFQAGEVVVVYPELSGSNSCSTYHPEKYVREVLAQNFDLVAFVPGGARDANQDMYLLRKP
jgi:2-polyprenyl-3-methyl-5-hydroxy-6-metoxy-1,4-benzoquinol methylase